MHVKNKPLSIAYKLILAAGAAAGVLIQLGVFEGSFRPGMFRYFTVLSNTLSVVYFAGAVAFLWRGYSRERTTWLPTLKGIALMSTTVTMLVAHFMLRLSFSPGSLFGLSVIVAHYAVPLMAIGDWLLFDRKGLMKPASPLIWMSGPAAYFIYAMIAARIGEGIGFNSRYPYPFMDVDNIGLGRVLFTAAVLTAGFLLLGYIFFGLDKLFSRLAKRDSAV